MRVHLDLGSALFSVANPSVSIVITNHNYGRFIAQAIESALAQTHDGVEVIVVDDGSTDDSRAVIGRYCGDVIAILKENGGQASAFNAGFARASGNAVIFLDADDVLHRETTARVAAAFAERSDLTKLHYRLELIDHEGRGTGRVIPPAGLRLPRGDLRELVRLHPDDIPYPPCTGNAFAAWALKRVLPMPEEEFRILADVYLLNLVPLLGPAEVLKGVGGSYRVHGANRHYVSKLQLERVRATIRTIHATHRYMLELATSLGLRGFPEPERDNRSLVFLSQRIVSRKLDPASHPLRGDVLRQLAVRGAGAALGRSDLGLGLRLLYGVWFFAMATAPRRIAPWVAEQMLYPERRGPLSALVEWLRRSP